MKTKMSTILLVLVFFAIVGVAGASHHGERGDREMDEMLEKNEERFEREDLFEKGLFKPISEREAKEKMEKREYRFKYKRNENKDNEEGDYGDMQEFQMKFRQLQQITPEQMQKLRIRAELKKEDFDKMELPEKLRERMEKGEVPEGIRKAIEATGERGMRDEARKISEYAEKIREKAKNGELTKEEIEKLKKLREEKIKEFKEKVKERIRRALPQRAAVALKRIEALNFRLEKIHQRIKARIDKLEEEGADVTESRKILVEAEAKIQKARELYKTLKVNISEATLEDLQDKEKISKAREMVKEIISLARSIKKDLKEAVLALKKAKQTQNETE